jgi:hypothetical protein
VRQLKAWGPGVVGLFVTAGVVVALGADWPELLADAGWWSAGLWLTLAIGFLGGYVAAVVWGGAWRGVSWLLLIVAAPVGGFVYGALLLATADPNPGCTEDCIGRLVVVVLGVVGAGAWLVGVLAGAFHRHLIAPAGG